MVLWYLTIELWSGNDPSLWSNEDNVGLPTRAPCFYWFYAFSMFFFTMVLSYLTMDQTMKSLWSTDDNFGIAHQSPLSWPLADESDEQVNVVHAEDHDDDDEDYLGYHEESSLMIINMMIMVPNMQWSLKKINILKASDDDGGGWSWICLPNHEWWLCWCWFLRLDIKFQPVISGGQLLGSLQI